MFDKYSAYPYKRYTGEPCQNPAVRAGIAAGQLEMAVSAFRAQVRRYCEAAGRKSSLTIAEKESVMPWLEMLAGAGWPVEYAEAVIWARDYDVKSIGDAEAAFRSLADFAIEAGGARPDAVHIGLYHIGEVLQKAARDRKSGFNPGQPRVPAGSSDGGEWTDGGGNSRAPSPLPEGDARPAFGGGLFRPVSDETQKAPRPPKQMRVSKPGVHSIMKHEGFRPNVYLDLAGKPTIGYGHLLKPGEKFPQGISKEKARELLQEDLRQAENAVQNSVRINLTEPQFDALTSLVFNIGGSGFSSSTLLRRLNEGKFEDAANQFRRWNKIRVNGVLKPSKGLTERRRAEEELFRSGMPDKAPVPHDGVPL